MPQEFKQMYDLREARLESHKTLAEAEVDDDGKPMRTGTVWTASAHIITAVVGAGVLALAWGIAQLGWIAGIGVLLAFSIITLFTYGLLADCYRTPDPVTGQRNYTYMQAVKSTLGGTKYIACGMVQYTKLTGLAIGYTITTSESMVAIQKSNCFHRLGHSASCKFSNNPYMIGLGIVQVFLSQIPSFHKLTWLSTLAATMSFGYAFIGIGLSMAVVIGGKGQKTSLTGVEIGPELSEADKIWRVFSGLGDMALACSYATVLLDIEDTLRSSPPECKQMRRANVIGISTMAVLFLTCGCFGYAAFGNRTPGNILTGFGFYEPFWLVDLANMFIVLHLVGAYQVICQPVFRVVELGANMKWPESEFITKDTPCKIGKMKFSVNLFRLIWRTAFVVTVTVLSMILPFFNEILALLGALGFWPLAIYFPVEMHIAQKQIRRLSLRWFALQILSCACFLVSLAAACGAIHGLNKGVHAYKPFMFKQ